MEKWYLTGNNKEEYDYGTVEATKDGERDHGFIAIKPEIAQAAGFGALVKSLDYEPFKGKRLCMSAGVRTENVDGWVGLWMRLDREPNKEVITLDNMQNRAISSTSEWQNYEIVLDVPHEATLALYGIILHGTG